MNISKLMWWVLVATLQVSSIFQSDGCAQSLAEHRQQALPGPVSQQSFQALPGQRILMNGDSITKGYGFGNYTDPSPLRTVYGIVQILMKDNLPRRNIFRYPAYGKD